MARREGRQGERVVEVISYRVLRAARRTLGFILNYVLSTGSLNSHDGTGIFKGSLAAEGKTDCRR